jgi:hypothetical protein
MTDDVNNAATWAEHMRSEFETLDVEQALQTMTAGPYSRNLLWCRGSFWRKTTRRSNASEPGSVTSMMSGFFALASHPKILPRCVARRTRRPRRPSPRASMQRQKQRQVTFETHSP